MDYFTYIEIILLIVLLIMLLRISLTPSAYPAAWKEAVKNKEVPASLIRMLRTYPDKQRFFVLWLQISRIRKEKIEGDFAELGVYKGDSARLINAMAPERKLHLFDTFDGFKDEDLKMESGEAATYTPSNFADTSMETVKERLGNPKQLVFHPGYFPASTHELEEKKFAFVNIDLDLYKPTKAGLEYFYPSLSRGGIILIHDYNRKWPMLMKAVDEFLDSIPENPVLLPDRDNSLAIVKNSTMRPKR
ncbi:MAG: TylF/MycF/NovP-related O-methyltransferase [Bacteroidota bacterium]|nr:TylF/MycF/NovP-related O-methyltransferase [Bacteroidota bacterium]